MRIAITPLSFAVLTTACAPVEAPDAIEAHEAPLTMQTLDGRVVELHTIALDRRGDAVVWEVEVEGALYQVDGDEASLQVRADDRLLFDVALTDDEVRFTADGLSERLDRPALTPDATTPVAEVDGAMAFPPSSGAAEFFAPMVERGNTLAAPLALVALPMVVSDAVEAERCADGYGQIEQPLLPYIVGGALIGGTAGAAWCLRSSTSASCSLGDGTTVGVTCNACQGTAYCNRTTTSGSSDGLIGKTLGADDDDDGGSVTCTCGCR